MQDYVTARGSTVAGVGMRVGRRPSTTTFKHDEHSGIGGLSAGGLLGLLSLTVAIQAYGWGVSWLLVLGYS